MNSLVLAAILGIFFMTITPASNPIRVKSNPRRGGWSKKKIKEYNKKTGSKLKHGVDYDPVTLEDFKRKGSWAIRHYKRNKSPDKLNKAKLVNKGELTPFSTQAIVWGEKPPKKRIDQKSLVKLGEKLLKVYQDYKEKGFKKSDKIPLKIRKKFKRSLKPSASARG